MISFNIVLTPPPLISSTLIEISQNTHKKYTSDILLNHSNALPHLTLFSGKIENRNLLELTRIGKGIVKETKEFSVKFTHIKKVFDGGIYLMAEYNRFFR